MTKTHKSTYGDQACVVTAWRFSKTAPIPLWVARNFHRIGGEGWEAIAHGGELVEAKEGDWAVLIEDEAAVVLTDEEFTSNFQPIVEGAR